MFSEVFCDGNSQLTKFVMALDIERAAKTDLEVFSEYTYDKLLPVVDFEMTSTIKNIPILNTFEEYHLLLGRQMKHHCYKNTK